VPCGSRPSFPFATASCLALSAFTRPSSGSGVGSGVNKPFTGGWEVCVAMLCNLQSERNSLSV
jgi:hypothetical protein